MSYLTIGSGDVSALLSGKQTKGYAELWRKFLSEHGPYYNAYASPIDALRTGAILEDQYIHYLPNDYFSQVKSESKEMSVFKSSIDFGRFDMGVLVDFDELKTIFLPDYLGIIKAIADLPKENQIEVIKKKFSNNYKQVQFQLMCAELDSGNLSFLSVETYEDHENEMRIIEDKDVTKFRIHRDEDMILKIKERGKIFQDVKDNFES